MDLTTVLRARFYEDRHLKAGGNDTHSFTISRAAGGVVYPLWKGSITSIKFKEPN